MDHPTSLSSLIKDKDLGSENLSALQNLAPLFFDGLASTKRIIISDAGTGRGKTYSINQTFLQLVKDPELFDSHNRDIYTADRRELVDEQYNEFIGLLVANGLNPKIAVRIHSNLDCIIEHFEVFKSWESYADLFNKAGESNKIDKMLYRQIKSSVKDLVDLRNGYQVAKISSTIERRIEEDLREMENQLRKQIRTLLRNDAGFLKCESAKEKIEYMESVPALNCILRVYDFVYALIGKVLFFTVQKGKRPFDSLIGTSYELLGAAEFLKDSIVFMDEFDSLRETLLEIEAEKQAECDIDLLAYDRQFLSNFKDRLQNFHPAISEDEHLVDDIDKWDERARQLNNKWHFMNPVVCVENLSINWMFVHNDSHIHSRDVKDMYVMYDSSIKSAVVTRYDCGEDYTFSNMVCDLNDLYESAIRLLKRVTRIYYEANVDEGMSLRAAASELVGYIISVTETDSNREGFINTILGCSKRRIEQAAANISDLYEQPEALIRAVKRENNRDLRITRHVISETPEGIVRRIVENDAKLFGISATSRNRSAFRNFNMDWAPLKDDIYHQSSHARQLEIDYAKNCDINSHLVNVSVEQTNKTMSSLKSYFKAALSGNINEKEFDAICSSAESADDERPLEDALELCQFMIHHCEKKILANLCFVNRKLNNNPYLLRLIDLVKNKYSNMQVIGMDASNISTASDHFEQMVRAGHPSFLVTPFNTAEKGLNLTVYVKNIGQLVHINTRNIQEKIIDGEAVIRSDICGFFMAKPTHVEDSLDPESTSKALVAACLKASFRDGDMLIREHITQNQHDAFMEKILRHDEYPFANDSRIPYRKDLNRSVMEKILSIVVQSTGRISRTNMQNKECGIVFSGKLVDAFNGISVYDYFTDDELEIAPFKVSRAIRSLFGTEPCNIISCEGINVVDLSEDIRDYDSASRRAMCNAIEDMHTGHNHLYEQLNTGIRALSVSKKEYNKLPPVVKKQYLHPARFRYGHTPGYENGYSYDINCNDRFGNVIVDRIYPLNEKSHKVCASEIFVDNHPMALQIKSFLEKNGFSFNTGNEYILSPNGFLKLKGNVGEFVGNLFMTKNLGFDVKPLENDLYESMDGYVHFGHYIVAVDYKHFNEGSELYDDALKYKAYYAKKLRDISDRYHMPVIGLMMNTSTMSAHLGEMPSKPYDLAPNIQMITIPSIFNQNYSYDNRVAQYIGETVSRFAAKHAVK